jgi:Ca2+-binding EF-hand superfamily protein
MLQEATGPLNFTQFLAIIGDKIMGQDKEDVIKAAFKTFDTNDTGKVSAKVLKKALMTWGEKLSDAEIEAALADAPIDSKGNVDILQYVKTISGSKEELD